MAYMDAGSALIGDRVWQGACPVTIVGVSPTFDHTKMGCRAITLTTEYNGVVIKRDYDITFRLELVPKGIK